MEASRLRDSRRNGNANKSQSRVRNKHLTPRASWFDNSYDGGNSGHSSEGVDIDTVYPTQLIQTSYCHPRESTPAPPTIIGHPLLRIFKFKLPDHLSHLLDVIVKGCNNHATTLPSGWKTDLYTLTKQDIALWHVPGMYEKSRPILNYIHEQIKRFYDVDRVMMDRNQPHVLKYSCDDGSYQTGVQLHIDKCDLTVNIMMSRPSEYVGGGTYFRDADTNVSLEFGEFLIHPGKVVHGGVDIARGTRMLMILFTHVTKYVATNRRR